MLVTGVAVCVLANAGTKPETASREKLRVGVYADVGARGFLYGGIGAGIARSRLSADGDATVTVSIPPAPAVVVNVPLKGSESKWRFLGQVFAGIGVYLNENWQLTAGYRLRYVPGSFRSDGSFGAIKSGNSYKQDIVHAAEIGLAYQF